MRWVKLARDVRGATVIEYGLIAALIFIAILGAVHGFAQTSINMWTMVANRVSTAS